MKALDGKKDHSHNDTQDVIMHEFPLLVATPHPCVVCLFWFGCGCVFCLFACFRLFLVWFLFVWFLAGTAPWTAYVHYQHFCGFRRVDSPACKLQFICLPRLNVCNDLAEAMKALDGKKSGTSREEHCATSLFNLVSNCFFSVQRQMALARSRKDNCILGSIFKCPLGMRVCKHSLVGGGDLVPHCDSEILEAGMPIRSVELHPYGQTAFEQ